MTSLSKRAEEIFKESLEPLMIAIQHDRQMEVGDLYSEDELLVLAIGIELYAIRKGKKIEIDPETKIVTLK